MALEYPSPDPEDHQLEEIKGNASREELLNKSISIIELPGKGSNTRFGAATARLNINTIKDLLEHLPTVHSRMGELMNARLDTWLIQNGLLNK